MLLLLRSPMTHNTSVNWIINGSSKGLSLKGTMPAWLIVAWCTKDSVTAITKLVNIKHRKYSKNINHRPFYCCIVERQWVDIYQRIMNTKFMHACMQHQLRSKNRYEIFAFTNGLTLLTTRILEKFKKPWLFRIQQIGKRLCAGMRIFGANPDKT